MADDSKIELPIEVTGAAEAQIKRITGAVGDLEAKGVKSLEAFGGASVSAFKIFAGSAVIVAGISAVKKALDLSFEAETVRAAGAQLDVLAKSAGISGEALKEGLVGAADGLIDDTDLIGIANQAIIEMGASAAGLPRIMELARKATSAFGGDLAHNFEAIEHAIATGQTRALKNFGIVIDSEQAYRAFALSVGTTADQLSQVGKQQAIMNAVLEQGGKQFAGVNVGLKEGTDSYQRLSVSLGQIGEAATLAFDKLFGPTIRGALKAFGQGAKDVQVILTASLGEGLDKAKAKVEFFNREISKQKTLITDLGASYERLKGHDPFVEGRAKAALEEANQQLLRYNISLRRSQSEVDTLAKAQEGGTAKTKAATASFIDAAAGQAKLAEEGKKIADRLAGEDPAAKYDKELEALAAFLVSKKEITDADALLLDQLEADRDAKREEKAQKELDDLVAKNEAMKSINQAGYAADIAANDVKISEIIKAEDTGSKLYLNHKKKEADAEYQIRQANMTASIGILGNMATVAKAFGEDGFAAFKAIASAQAIVSSIQGAAAAVAPPPIGAGPLFGPILAATTIAAGIANVAQINATHLAGGIDSVPTGFERDNFRASLQTGERVVPRDSNKKLTAMLNGEGPMIQLLRSIDDKLSRQPGAIVNIDGREVFNSMRSQLQGGRSFA